jgi:hypothetical protein
MNKILSVFLLSLLSIMAVNVQAQAPGNLTVTTNVAPNNLRLDLWLDADRGVTNSGGIVSTWNDQSSYGRHHGVLANTNNNYKPRYTTADGMNFHPKLTFDGRQFLGYNYSGTAAFEASRIYYVFFVSKKNDTGANFATVYTPFLPTTSGRLRANNGWWNNQPAFATASTANGTSISGTVSDTYTTAAHPFYGANNKKYAITGIERANTPNDFQYQYKNGVANTYPAATFGTTAIADAQKISLVGGASNTNAAPVLSFNGDIQEIIVFSKAGNTDSGHRNLTSDELARINTYLSIKYGISLDDGDYVTLKADEQVKIWERTAMGNIGYNNHVFGIGRNDASVLYQKQSIACDGGRLTAYIGSSLAALNSANDGTFADDDTYIVFGSNNKSAVVPYDYIGSEVPDMFPEQLNTRSSEAFRVHITIPAGATLDAATTDGYSVTLKTADTHAKYLIVSNDPTFPFTTEAVGLSLADRVGKTRAYAIDQTTHSVTVPLFDGEYISFVYPDFVVSPGAVDKSTLSLWLKPDSLALTAVGNWADASGNNRDHQQNTGGNKPTAAADISKAMNFQPYVAFDGNDYLRANYYVDANHAYYVFAVSEKTTDTELQYAVTYSLAGSSSTSSSYTYHRSDNGWYRNRPAFMTRTSNTSSSSRISSSLSPSSSALKDMDGRISFQKSGTYNKYGIQTVVRPNNTSTSQQLYVDGLRTTFPAASMGTLPPSTSSDIPSAKYSVLGGAGEGTITPFTGTISEIITLAVPTGTLLSPEQVLKIHSYLALKYGISLTRSNYQSSAGNIIWDYNNINYTAYSKNIFGLARDNNSGLNIKQATSYNRSTVIAYFGTLSALNRDNSATGFTKTNTFALFGSNGADGHANYNSEYGAHYDNATLAAAEAIPFRFAETLKVKLTNFPVEAPNDTLIVNMKVLNTEANVLMVSSDPEFPTKTKTPIHGGAGGALSGWIWGTAPCSTRIYPLTDGVATDVKIHDGDYITYATIITSPPIGMNIAAAYNVEVWLKAHDLTGTLANNAPVDTWTSHGSVTTSSSGGVVTVDRNFTRGSAGTAANNRPVFQTTDDNDRNIKLMNFHPAVGFRFDADAYKYMVMESSPALQATKSYYIFTVTQNEKSNQNTATVFAPNVDSYFGWKGKKPFYHLNAANDYTYTLPSSTAYGITAILVPNNAADRIKLYNNGDWQETPPALLSTTPNDIRIGGVSGFGSTNVVNPFLGNLQELLVLSNNAYGGTNATQQGMMNPVQVQRVLSYLAIKYGITLTIGDYISSHNEVIWSRTKARQATGVYDQNIFGIGECHGMLGLRQVQSRAYREEPAYPSPFSVSMANFATTNEQNTAYGADAIIGGVTWPAHSFIMFAANKSDVNTVVPLTNIFPAGTYNEVEVPDALNYATETYHVQTLHAYESREMSFPAINFKNELGAEFPDAYLLISKDPEFPSAGTYGGGNGTTVYKFDNTTHIVTGVTVHDGDYIIIAVNEEEAPGGVIGDFRMWMRADAKDSLNLWPANSDATGNPLNTNRYKTYLPTDVNYLTATSSLHSGTYVAPTDGREFDVHEWTSSTKNAVKYRHMNGENQNPGPHFHPGYVSKHPDMNFHPAVTFMVRSSSTGLDDTRGDYLSTNPTGARGLPIVGAPVMSVNTPEHYTFITLFNNHFNRTRNTAAYPIGFGNTNVRWNDGSSNGSTGSGSGESDARAALGVEMHTTGSGSNLVIGAGGRWSEYDSNAGRDVPTSGSATSTDGTVVTQRNDLFHPGETMIMYHEIDKNDSIRFEFDADGETLTKARYASIANIGTQTRFAGPGTLGAGSASSRNLNGSMGEIIAYERKLSDLEKHAVYSYLGLKYGVTLDLDKVNPEINFDYFLSDRTTVVWPGTSSVVHQKYHHHVTALVTDNQANFSNTQAQSTDVNSVVWMGNGTNPAWEKKLNDKEAIVWGDDDNNGILYFAQPVSDTECGVTQRMRKVWLVDKSSEEVDTVTIRLDGPDNETFPFRGNGWQVYVLIADSEEDLYAGEPQFDDNGDLIAGAYSGAVNNWKHILPASYIDGKHQVSFALGQKYTYFTIGADPVDPSCQVNEGQFFTGRRKLEFVASGTTSAYAASIRGGVPLVGGTGTGRVFPLGTDNSSHQIIATVKTTYNGTARSVSKSYPRPSSLKSLRIYNSRVKTVSTNALQPPAAIPAAAGEVVTSIKLRTTNDLPVAAAPSFEIFDIDAISSQVEQVTIYGTCSDNVTVIKPKLTMIGTAARSTYTVKGNVATATRKGVSYTNTQGRLLVEFENPVENIYVVLRTLGRNSNSSLHKIGIGPITFTTPVPVPPFNEAGLAFSKEVIDTTKTCLPLEYTYRIYNANCDSKLVNLTDMLPEHLTWVANSLSMNSEAMGTTTTFNDYAGTRNLAVTNLIVPGRGVLLVRATALFDYDAPPAAGDAPAIYESLPAHITYNYYVDSELTPGTLDSRDRFTGTANSKTAVYNQEPRLRPITVRIEADKTCYVHDNLINYTITLTNPNEYAFENIVFDLTQDSALLVTPGVMLPGSVTVDNFSFAGFTNTPVTVNVNEGISDPSDLINNLYMFKSIIIPAAASAGTPATATVTFTLQAPADDVPLYAENGIDYILDEYGDIVYQDIQVNFAFEPEGEDEEAIVTVDECEEAAIGLANGYLEVPRCSTHVEPVNFILTNKHITNAPESHRVIPAPAP